MVDDLRIGSGIDDTVFRYCQKQICGNGYGEPGGEIPAIVAVSIFIGIVMGNRFDGFISALAGYFTAVFRFIGGFPITIR